MATLEEARLRLGYMLQWQAAPALTSGELDALAALLPQMIDAAGLYPGEVGYVPTYPTQAGLYRAAAAEGWEWKAAKVAGQFDAAVGTGTKFDRSQAFKMCMEMSATYGGGSGGALSGVGVLGSVLMATDRTARCD